MEGEADRAGLTGNGAGLRFAASKESSDIPWRQSAKFSSASADD